MKRNLLVSTIASALLFVSSTQASTILSQTVSELVSGKIELSNEVLNAMYQHF
jgi:hypothetical protein